MTMQDLFTIKTLSKGDRFRLFREEDVWVVKEKRKDGGCLAEHELLKGKDNWGRFWHYQIVVIL